MGGERVSCEGWKYHPQRLLLQGVFVLLEACLWLAGEPVCYLLSVLSFGYHGFSGTRALHRTGRADIDGKSVVPGRARRWNLVGSPPLCETLASCRYTMRG